MQGPGSDQTADGGLFPSIVIAGCAAFWGLYWIPLRETEALGVPPLWSVALFNLPLFLISGLIFAWFFSRNRQILGTVMLAGCLAGAGLALYGLGLMMTTVVRATLLFYLTPVWGTVIGVLVLSERPGIRRWFALALGIGGLALTIGLTPEDLKLEFGMGEAVGLLAGLVWAISATVIRKSGGLPVSGLAFFEFAAAFFITSLFALVFDEVMITVEIAIAGINWYLIIGAVIMLVTMTAIFVVIGRLSPGRSGLLMMTEVIVAVFSAAILLPKEALSMWEWVGAALIISAGIVEVTGAEA